jgi:APA family basic amino acid/polyamine antiporter
MCAVMEEPSSRLVRRLGIPGATVVGLGAMLGTGVFAVWSPALVLAGSLLIGAFAVAACVAALNAWSTGKLAMVHPESGGAYAYGRIYVNRFAGVTAGVAFVIGKSSSAAAAALVIAVYVAPDHARLVAIAVIALALLIEVRGLHRTVLVSAALVIVVLGILLALGVAGSSIRGPQTPLESPNIVGLLAGAALCFFAFAGYARVTVLGEEVRQPRRTIPRAMVIAMSVVAIVYLGLAFVVLHAAQRGVVIGPAGLLDVVAAWPGMVVAAQVGVVLAAGAALLALIAGVSRTVFAMAARGDAPAGLARIDHGLPRRAQILAAGFAVGLAAVGQLSWALALSATSVLLYYAIAHLAAHRMSDGPPRWVPLLGMVGCLALAGALAWAAVTGELPRT